MSSPILYNVTVHVENSIAKEWVSWMKDIHIPDVMNTEMFSGFHFSKILNDTGDDCTSYAILYIAKDQRHLDQYQKDFAPDLQKEHIERYGEKALAFRTLMEQIDAK